MPWLSMSPLAGSSPAESSPRAVAVYPFDPGQAGLEDGQGDGVGGGQAQWHLRLDVGDVVVLKEEESDAGWYLGHLLHNPGLTGVFPKTYVSVLHPSLGPPPIVEEITSSLREWNGHLKDKYAEDAVEELTVVRALMREILSMRSSLLAGKMTVEETREVQRKATTKMDFLNRSLGLDLLVRDAGGTVLNPQETSAVGLFRAHVEASEKLKNMMLPRATGGVSGEASNFFKIMLSVKNFVSSKVLEDVDLVMSIYEVGEANRIPKPLCENYVVRGWRRNPNDPEDIERRNNLKVIFADISKNDITSKRLFLICNVVSEGTFSAKSHLHPAQSAGDGLPKSASRGDLRSGGGAGHSILFRKPVGVAAVEITDLFTFKQGKSSELGRESEVSAPFLSGGDNEPFDSVFRKLVFDRKSTDAKSLWVSLNIMMGDLNLDAAAAAATAPIQQQQRLSHPLHHHPVMVGPVRVPVARKIGLPEVILPSDFRNDLYVSLVCGEFSRLDKRSDRNVEVSVEVCNERGEPLQGALSAGQQSDGGSAVTSASVFRSVVFYHEGKPRWNEVFKVTIPVDLFSSSHLRFTFRHRSSNASKEKSAPWALAFLKLVNDHDETAVRDGLHDLLVYKIENKKLSSSLGDIGQQIKYLDLPFLKNNQYHLKQKAASALTFLPKDNFVVQTTLCSTKLTQNEGLRSLLKWRDDPSKLNENLNIFNQKVNGKEFVKFLPDVLDALFSILTENSDADQYDYKIFKSLINVIHLITEDTRYQQFVPVLDMYILENFSATLAYNKLLYVLQECVQDADLRPMDLIQAMKSLKYIFKFVVRSRFLFAKLNGGRGREPFQTMLGKVLESLVQLMHFTSEDLYTGQSYCLKHIVNSIPDLVEVFDRRQLAEIIVRMVQSLPRGQLSEQKINTLRELAHSKLFEHPECRSVIMPEVSARIRDILNFEDSSASADLAPVCTVTLGDLLDSLHRFEGERPGSTLEDVTAVVRTVLRTIIKAVVNRKDCGPVGGAAGGVVGGGGGGGDRGIQAMVSNLVGLFRAMTPRHYAQYIDSFRAEEELAGRSDLVDFVMEVMGMIRDLVQHSVFSSDWVSMILLQNSVFLQAMKHFANTIRDHLKDPFEYHAWNNFFQCAVTFMIQPSLQLERFSESKRERIRYLYKDMRKEMGMSVKAMWFNLGGQKIRFVPEMVGPFLEMTLIPETDLRKATIPIFFDMMQCEYYSSKQRREDGEIYDTKRDVNMSKGNFKEFEKEIIVKLDAMIETGSGDDHYKVLFRQIMMSHCMSHTALNRSGEALVDLVTRLMEILLEYRTITNEESVENQMSCIVNLFDFYSAIRREELYLKYLKKLCSLHEASTNWSEAACTLLQFADQLSWTDRPLRGALWDRHRSCKTHRSLKEQLYRDAIVNFEKGKMWERALKLCKELARQYEEETYDYVKLDQLHQRMSSFYRSITTEMRPDPEYFRVAFYGRGFPAFLQNKVFVYRGRGFERLPEFQGRMLNQFPNAELMKTLKAPSEADKERPVQLLQINMVVPVMSETKFRGKFVHQQIVGYYKVNEVNQFIFSRPFSKNKDKSNEFASLWIERTVMRTKYSFPGVLQWFPLSQSEETFELCPLENAVESMQKVNEDLRSMILEHQDGRNPPLNPLSMKLNGIIDAAVMGGTANYERAFFTEEYARDNPDHADLVRQLKNLIAEQIPLLEAGIRIHDFKKTDDLKQLHLKLEGQFRQQKRDVEEKYGKKPSDIVVKRVGGGHQTTGRKSSAGGTGGTLDSRRGGGNFISDSRLSIVPSFSTQTSDAGNNRVSLASHNSVDASMRSRMLSTIGITRKKSSAALGAGGGATEGSRTSLNRSQHSSSAILENGGGSGAGTESNGSGDSMYAGGGGASYEGGESLSGAASIVVTQTPTCRLMPSTASSIRPQSTSGGSRPVSGQFLIFAPNTSTSTPTHSRPPSVASNRESVGGGSFLGVDDDEGGIGGNGNHNPQPPPVPPKLNRTSSDAESVSVSSLDDEKPDKDGTMSVAPVKHIIVSGKKKAPPPPPPLTATGSATTATTPQTPPKKAPLRPPVD